MFVQPLVGTPADPALVHVTIERILFDRQEAGRVRPVFEQRACLEQLLEPARVVVTEAAPQHEVGTAGDDVDGIDLQNVHLSDDRADSFFGGTRLWAIVQTLRSDHQSAHGVQGKGFHRHPLSVRYEQKWVDYSVTVRDKTKQIKTPPQWVESVTVKAALKDHAVGPGSARCPER